MSTTLVDNPKVWKTRQERPATLEIVLSKRTYVLPWVQFLAFATHEVTVKGGGLQSLLADLAAQRIAQLHEPSRPDQFENGSSPCIRAVIGKRRRGESSVAAEFVSTSDFEVAKCAVISPSRGSGK